MKKLLNTLYVTDPDARLVKADARLSVLVCTTIVSCMCRFHLLDGDCDVWFIEDAAPRFWGECAERGISMSFLDANGRFLARLEGPVSGNVLLRRAQYRLSDDAGGEALAVAKRFVEAKIVNERRVFGAMSTRLRGRGRSAVLRCRADFALQRAARSGVRDG